MRSKRRKASLRCTQNSQERKSKRCTLDILPPDVLGIILRMLSLHDVACTIRLVSKRCYDIAATVLNSEFLVAGTKLKIAIKRMRDLVNSVKTDIEMQDCSRTFNMLELIRSQYRMLKAVTWRYTHPRSHSSPISCFYGGEVLDNLNCLLQAILEPCRGSSIVLSFVDLQIFMRSCENFMDHFEKVTERRVNRSALISGCKIIDVLDCLEEGRQLLSFRTSSRVGNSTISMQLRYVLKRTWFTCLQVPNVNDEHCWRDKQRYMYLRLRRLVCSFNKHLLYKLHYKRKFNLRVTLPSRIPPRKPPEASIYSGYGEYGGQFFYYGNMSKYAYDYKFKYARPGNVENADRELEQKTNRPPQFDLVITVELRCSSELAPLAARENLKDDDLEDCSTNSSQELYLKLSMKCAASKANRLPDVFVWEVCSP